MIFVKENFSRDKFEDIFEELWVAMWGPEQLDLSKPELLAVALSRHVSDQEVQSILGAANDKIYKQKLLDATAQVVEAGAFGCPWIFARNADGITEPFFGSDRYAHLGA